MSFWRSLILTNLLGLNRPSFERNRRWRRASHIVHPPLANLYKQEPWRQEQLGLRMRLRPLYRRCR